MYLIFILFFPLCFGVADMLWMSNKTETGFFQSIFIRSIFSTAITFVSIFIFDNNYHFNIADFAIPIIISITSFIAFLFYYKSLQQPSSGINAALTRGVSTVIVFSITSILFHQFSVYILFATAILFIGFLFLGGIKNNSSKLSKHAITAGILWGISFSFFGQAVFKIGSYWFAFLLELVVLIGAGITCIFSKKNKHISLNNSFTKRIASIGILTGIGSIANNLCYNYYSPTAIIIAGKLVIILPLLFGILFLHQKISKSQWLGIACILLAICIAVWKG